jgi:hypothetical protein
MAKVWKAPIDPPEISIDALCDGSYREIEAPYLEALAAQARENGSDEAIGKVIRFQRADGYAQYMVWNTRPLELIWLELGDSYAVEAATIRGLNLTEVREQMVREEKMAELFGRRDEVTEQ